MIRKPKHQQHAIPNRGMSKVVDGRMMVRPSTRDRNDTNTRPGEAYVASGVPCAGGKLSISDGV